MMQFSRFTFAAITTCFALCSASVFDMGADMSSMIQDAERMGRDRMIERSMLPVAEHPETKGKLRRLGFVFGDQVDSVLVPATFPDGWTFVEDPNNHRTAYVLNAEGEKALVVFIKTTNYDYHGGVHIVSNSKEEKDEEDEEEEEAEETKGEDVVDAAERRAWYVKTKLDSLSVEEGNAWLATENPPHFIDPKSAEDNMPF